MPTISIDNILGITQVLLGVAQQFSKGDAVAGEKIAQDLLGAGQQVLLLHAQIANRPIEEVILKLHELPLP